MLQLTNSTTKIH